jgi:hypothetical protein
MDDDRTAVLEPEEKKKKIVAKFRNLANFFSEIERKKKKDL